MQMFKNVGQLEVICGGMFSGKTKELIRRLERYIYAQTDVLLFKHSNDKRYDNIDVVTHDGIKMKAIPISSFDEIESILQLSNTKIIGIDEAQFFNESDFADNCNMLVNHGYTVIVSGLDMTWNGESFGNMPRLLILADKITKLKAICNICGRDAYGSKRVIKCVDQVVIGGKETYNPRCRGCMEI